MTTAVARSPALPVIPSVPLLPARVPSSSVPAPDDFTAAAAESPVTVERLERLDRSQAVTSLLQDVDARQVVRDAARIVQLARARLAENLSPEKLEEIDARHRELAAAPLPKTLDEAVSTLLDRLEIGGEARRVVEAAVTLIVDEDEPAPRRMMESIGGVERDNPDTHSTQMAVTDEGWDHVLMTLADPRMLNKAWAHIERIDRVDSGGVFSEHTFPYGLPTEKLIAVIRLFLGESAPATVFYGSPRFLGSAVTNGLPEGSDDLASAGMRYNFPDAVNDLVIVGERLFAHGVSEVKVTMDGLSAEEATRLMSAVSAQAKPRPGREYFSAAFNLNKGLLDLEIVPPGTPRIATAPTPEQRALLARVGQEAIDVTRAGGFGKVTLDSASLTPPSYPLIEFFGVRNLVDWVHHAHQAGLETYVSGGMQSYHFPLLAFTGVDGVGVGTSIHGRTDKAGVVGRMLPDRVHDALARRDAAEVSPVGQATYLLCRLDEIEASGKLTPQMQALQERVHQALATLADQIDVELDVLKQARDGGVEALKAQDLAPAELKARTDQLRSVFQQGFEALIARALNEGAAVDALAALAQEGLERFGIVRGSTAVPLTAPA